jgi:hypothetical protein
MHYACIINAARDGRYGFAVNWSSHLPAHLHLRSPARVESPEFSGAGSGFSGYRFEDIFIAYLCTDPTSDSGATLDAKP